MRGLASVTMIKIWEGGGDLPEHPLLDHHGDRSVTNFTSLRESLSYSFARSKELEAGSWISLELTDLWRFCLKTTLSVATHISVFHDLLSTFWRSLPIERWSDERNVVYVDSCFLPCKSFHGWWRNTWRWILIAEASRCHNSCVLMTHFLFSALIAPKLVHSSFSHRISEFWGQFPGTFWHLCHQMKVD